MKKLTLYTRIAICSLAVALAIIAICQNPGHLFSAALIFAVGLNVEWKDKEDGI